jgi:hypothetical protein
VLLLVNDNNFSPRQLPTTFVALALTEEVTVTLSSDIGSLVGTIRAVPTITPVDGIEGRYSDPNHPAGFRTVVVSARAQGDDPSSVVTIAGNDNAPAGVEWTLFGRLRIESDTILLTVDFSPKGGPANVVAVFDGSGLQFTDGNRWPQQDTAGHPVELVAAFKGIPYASPPVGHRRFTAPEPYDGPYAAGTGQKLGAACPQTRWLSYYAPEESSEDCLFLNVYSVSMHGCVALQTGSRAH